MTIRLGIASIGKVRHGANEILRAYKGETLLYDGGGPAPSDALADFLAAKGAMLWIDGRDPVVHFQERAGSPPATPSGPDGVVGSIFNKGTGGGYMRAPADSARGLWRAAGYVQSDGIDDYYMLPGSLFDSILWAPCTMAVVARMNDDREGKLATSPSHAGFGFFQDWNSDTNVFGAGASHARLNGLAFTGSRADLHAALNADYCVVSAEYAEMVSFDNFFYMAQEVAGGDLWDRAAGNFCQLVVLPGLLDAPDRGTLEMLLAGRIPA